MRTRFQLSRKVISFFLSLEYGSFFNLFSIECDLVFFLWNLPLFDLDRLELFNCAFG